MEIEHMTVVSIPRRTVLVASLIFLAIFVFLSGRLYYNLSQDYYWTPMQHALPPSKARDRVEIYTGNQILGDTVDGRAITLRFNNKDKIARDTLAECGFFLGAGVVLLVIWIFGARGVKDHK